MSTKYRRKILRDGFGEYLKNMVVAKHVARVRNGALVSILKNKLEKSDFKTVCPENILLVGITPASWKLPRDFSFTEQDGKTLLKTDTRKPPNEHHYVNQVAI